MCSSSATRHTESFASKRDACASKTHPDNRRPFLSGSAKRRAAPTNCRSPSRACAPKFPIVSKTASTPHSNFLRDDVGLSDSASQQIVDYLGAAKAALGILPTQTELGMERFFDESGGMQLIIHTPYGSRLNRAWGLALRKRFCRSFNFELQAAATEDAIVLSLSTSHSFPLEEVTHYLHSNSVCNVLTQALLDAPMFGVRWRWNATTALALPRFQGGSKVPPQLQRMKSEDLLATVFPDQVACLENIVGERQIPEHPLVAQTMHDCLYEAMDLAGLEKLLRRFESGEVQFFCRDLTAPSPLAAEVLTARPYAYLDDAPLEERRTQAVMSRQWGDVNSTDDFGKLDIDAIASVRDEAWPQVRSADELHEALMVLGFVAHSEIVGHAWTGFLDELLIQRRTTQLRIDSPIWIATERIPQFQSIYPDATFDPPTIVPGRIHAHRVDARSRARGDRARPDDGSGTGHRRHDCRITELAAQRYRSRVDRARNRRLRHARPFHAGHGRTRMVRTPSARARPSLHRQPATPRNRTRRAARFHAFPVRMAARRAGRASQRTGCTRRHPRATRGLRSSGIGVGIGIAAGARRRLRNFLARRFVSVGPRRMVTHAGTQIQWRAIRRTGARNTDRFAATSKFVDVVEARHHIGQRTDFEFPRTSRRRLSEGTRRHVLRRNARRRSPARNGTRRCARRTRRGRHDQLRQFRRLARAARPAAKRAKYQRRRGRHTALLGIADAGRWALLRRAPPTQKHRFRKRSNTSRARC